MSWRQTFLVLKREYLTRVKSKGFIWATILVPLGFALFIGVRSLLRPGKAIFNIPSAISDETGQIINQLEELDDERYKDLSGTPSDSLRAMVQREEITGYVVITEQHITGESTLELIYSGSGGLQLLPAVRSDFRESIRQERLHGQKWAMTSEIFLKARVAVDSRRLSREGEETEDDTEFLSIVGFLMGVIIIWSAYSAMAVTSCAG
jgi:ABC-2 type transport system permease protein